MPRLKYKKQFKLDPAPGQPGPIPPPRRHIIRGPLEDAIVAAVTAQAIAALLVAAPWTGLPVLSGMIRFFISKIIKFFMDQTILGVNDVWIQVDNAGDVKAVKEATQQLKDLKPDSDPALIAAARAAFEKAAGDLIRIKDAPF